MTPCIGQPYNKQSPPSSCWWTLVPIPTQATKRLTPLHQAAAGVNKNPAVITALGASRGRPDARNETAHPPALGGRSNENPAVITLLGGRWGRPEGAGESGSPPCIPQPSSTKTPRSLRLLLNAGATRREHTAGPPWEKTAAPQCIAALAGPDERKSCRLTAASRPECRGRPECARPKTAGPPCIGRPGSIQNPAVITTLLDAGADAKAKDRIGQNSIRYALEKNAQLKTEKRLKGRVTSIERKDAERAWQLKKLQTIDLPQRVFTYTLASSRTGDARRTLIFPRSTCNHMKARANFSRFRRRLFQPSRPSWRNPASIQDPRQHVPYPYLWSKDSVRGLRDSPGFGAARLRWVRSIGHCVRSS